MSDFTERLTRAHTGDEKAREELILENRSINVDRRTAEGKAAFLRFVDAGNQK